MPECFCVPRALAPYFEPIQSHYTTRIRRCKQVGCSRRLCRSSTRIRSNPRISLFKVSFSEEKPLGKTSWKNLGKSLWTHGGKPCVQCRNNDRYTEKVSSVHYWLDSTVALYWIGGQGELRQIVSNRVKKIKDHDRVKWHYVPTKENPADLHMGSRGA